MEHETSVGFKLHELGWKQGSYIACSELSEDMRDACSTANKVLQSDFSTMLADRRNVLVLLTQACDIVAATNHESDLEFVIARRPKKASQPHFRNLDARSTRYLELNLNGTWYKAEANKTLQIPKQIFFDQVSAHNLSSNCLEDKDIEVLARWRANRYMRKALPDDFNNKVKSLIDNGTFDSDLEHAGGLYLNIDPFAPSDHYIVRLFALLKRGSSEDKFDALYTKMESILDAINEIDGLTCPFIETEENSVFLEVAPAMRRIEVSIALRDHFMRWNFDYISLSVNDSKGIDED